LDWMLLAPISGLAALTVAWISARLALKESPGSSRMMEIAGAIQEGSVAYLKRQYTTIWTFVMIIAALLAVAPNWGFFASIAFVGGALSSTIAGFLGMHVAIRANSRTANATLFGLSKALKVAFHGGLAMGMFVTGIGLLGTLLFYYWSGRPELVLPYSFGASAVALFARVGGGIYTKTADIGADLVGKVEAGIPEDDPRNPAVIADQVGDNVGDVAGMGADLFESYVASTVAAMIIGYIYYDEAGVILPLLICAVGIIASILAVFFVRVKEGKDPSYALNGASVAACVLTAIGSCLVSQYVFGWEAGLKLFIAIVCGLVAGLVIGFTSDYFTNRIHHPAQFTAESAQSGAAIGILTGFSMGLLSTVLPIIAIAVAVVVAYFAVGNIYGIVMAGVGMLAVTGIVVASDAYGPIADNAGGLVEMSGLPEEARNVTDALDSVGNTTKAICKGFAIGSAALTAIALFTTYSELAKVSTLDLLKPSIVAGLFLGGCVVALFCALVILAVGRNAFRMVEEVRRQFREIPGLLEGRPGAKPDYKKCVEISTHGAIKELIAPGLSALIMPIVVGFILGRGALGGFLAGSIVTGLIFALLMANAGGLWDNAKKFIEMGHYGGKRTPTHAAAVVGDTVGDPFKDTAGPSINILIKLMTIIAIIIAPFLV